ncbi:TatD DNase family protein [Paenibacillus endophyticus]|uniref:TatD DNase family protein n=1 Tax=Paenibacillus endophyticus TaxID=1294268 RepID=A0A7W5C7M1_9BACL|nr:TatD family hydrolase [Paenibacillus endophyticus]MBB3152175.1 TatD DNase family protein [Paenibacillus endophyticus]
MAKSKDYGHVKLPEESGAKAYAACIDAHIHVDLYAEEERNELLEQAFAEGVEAVVAVSMHLASAKVNRELAREYAGRVYPAYGFHPEQPMPEEEEMDELIGWIRSCAAAGELFAIGEVGLPYYSRLEAEQAGEGAFDEKPYVELLERFAELAAELDLPIVLHAVYEDAAKACDILEKYGVRRAHFHWFKGDDAVISRMAASGYMVSVTPDVAYEEEIRQLVAQYPIELLMVETDGPWPFEGPYEGRQTKPAMAADAAKHIASIKQQPPHAVAEALLANTRRFYGLQQ